MDKDNETWTGDNPDHEVAVMQGWIAGNGHCEREANPWPKFTVMHEFWDAGWLSSHEHDEK